MIRIIEDTVNTYIPGASEMLGGGIPKNALLLVTGPPGAMKSTLVYNIFYNNSKIHNTKSLFISIETRRKVFLQQMQGLGMNDPTIVANIHLIDIGKLRKRSEIQQGKEWLGIFKRFIMSLKTNFAFELLALDSIGSLKFIIGEPDYCSELFELFEWLRDLEVNVFIISEMKQGELRICEHDEEFLVDGILHLKMEPQGPVRVERRIQCVKMRAAKNSLDNFAFNFDDGEFQITKIIKDQ